MVKLPKYKSAGEVTDWFKVPEQWDDHRRRAKQILSENEELLSELRGVHSTSLTQSPKKYGGRNGLQIRLSVSQGFEETQAPSEIEGVPVSVSQRPKPRPTASAACTNLNKDTNLGAGEHMAHYSGTGTAGAICFNGSGKERMLTVAHIFYDYRNKCGVDIDSRTAVTYAQSNLLGQVETHSIEDDWAVVDRWWSGDYTPYIDDNDADSYPKITGIASEYAIEYWVSNPNSRAHQMGCTSGHTTGSLSDCHVSQSQSCSVEGAYEPWTYSSDGDADGIETSCDVAGGDSGGPVYAVTKDTREAKLISINNQYVSSGTSYVYCDLDGDGNNNKLPYGFNQQGIAAYKIENNTNYTIGT